MAWRHLFSRVLLERGEEYFQSNRVGNYRKQYGMHMMSIRGTKNYNVYIELAGGTVNGMKCNCAYAKSGSRCEHMAAALYYLESKKLLRVEELFPLEQLTKELFENKPETENKPYRYFDCEELKTFIEESARFYNCQFIIATHSPFLLALNDAKIYDLDCVPVKTKKWTELENVKVYNQFFKEHSDEFE